MSATPRVKAVACGSALPERVVTNAELARMVDTSDEWIAERTGISERRIAAEGELTSDLATRAADATLSAAGWSADSLDLIVLATATPDHTFPATAARVQAALGMTKGAAFDVQAVCSGFVYGTTVADAMLRGGQGTRALVIGAETFSRILDWEDRGTCVLFGDGAGAMALELGEGGNERGGGAEDRGVLVTRIHSDGRHHDLLYVDGGPSSTKTVGHLRMHGREVFRHAVANLCDAVEEVLEAAALSADDVDWVIPHQANRRIIDATAKRLGMPIEKVVLTVDKHGNTSAASIPLALAEALGDGRVREGDLLLLEAMGGGFTWGSALIRWGR